MLTETKTPKTKKASRKEKGGEAETLIVEGYSVPRSGPSCRFVGRSDNDDPARTAYIESVLERRRMLRQDPSLN
jgi:hypothetical protein